MGNFTTDEVLRFNASTGEQIGVVVSSRSGGLSNPSGLALTPAAVPEPAGLVLFGIGTLGVLYLGRRQR